MSDLAEMRVALEAARQQVVDVAGAKFTLRLPSQHQWRIAYESHVNPNGAVMQGAAFRALLEQAVVDWSGVTQAHILPGGDAGKPVKFDAEARTLLLDYRQDIADELSIALSRQNRAFLERYEAAEKN